jgi:hypothetical protein
VVSVFNATILANAPAAKGFLAVARLLRNQTLPNLHVARQILGVASDDLQPNTSFLFGALCR